MNIDPRAQFDAMSSGGSAEITSSAVVTDPVGLGILTQARVQYDNSYNDYLAATRYLAQNSPELVGDPSYIYPVTDNNTVLNANHAMQSYIMHHPAVAKAHIRNSDYGYHEFKPLVNNVYGYDDPVYRSTQTGMMKPITDDLYGATTYTDAIKDTSMVRKLTFEEKLYVAETYDFIDEAVSNKEDIFDSTIVDL